MKRPLSVTIIGWLFILAGTVGLLYHATEISLDAELVWVLVVRLAAILGGVLLLKGVNTGRWLLIGWMAYHVVLSFYHSVFGLAMHVLFLGALALILFSAQVTKYFRRTPA